MDAEGEALTSFDYIEWRDVCQRVRPELTDEEFDELWIQFQAMKGRKRLQ